MTAFNLAKYITTGAGVIAVGWFWYGHFASAGETEQRSKENAAIVKELQEIKRAEFEREQGERNAIRKLCANGGVHERTCAEFGVPYVPPEDE